MKQGFPSGLVIIGLVVTHYQLCKSSKKATSPRKKNTSPTKISGLVGVVIGLVE